jgi:GntR family transcriptional regulator, transcriptional repressor for pyruvate dehydrogenase complex
MFKEASQNRIFQDVVHQIQDAIFSGRLNRGDMLPPERDLKEMFHTSRGTLREALRVLEERGLIKIRLGVSGGAVVTGMTTKHASETLALLIRSKKISLNHLAEFREGIEGQVASLAAERADENDIQELNGLLRESAPYIEETRINREAFLDVDRRFHLALSRISRNPVYAVVIESVHNNIHRYYDQFLSMNLSELKENYQDLYQISQAVEKGRSKDARVLMQSHVLRFNRHMKEKK